jgi:hypothetical protein
VITDHKGDVTMNSRMNKRMSKRRTLARTGALLLAGAASAAVAGPTINFDKNSSLTIDYALQVWMQNRGYTSSTDSGSLTQTFLRRNRLTFTGQYNDYVGFYAQLDAPNNSKDTEADRNVFYRDAYITLDFSDPVRFIVGRFKNTFTRENLEACLEPLTLDRAEVISYTPFAGSRDTGAAMWGNLANARFQYRLMAANGRNDQNSPEHAPRFTARVHWSFFDPEFDYGYRGTYLGTKKVLTIGAAYDYQKDVAYADSVLRTDPKNYKASTVDIFYEQPTASGTYTFSAAKMKYDTGDAINGPAPDASLPLTSQLEGYYVKGGYLLPQPLGIGRLQLFLRHEKSDYNLRSGLHDQKWNSVGFNYYLDGQRLKVTFEHAKIDFEKQSPTDPSLQDYSQTTLGLQLMF